jgi:predicted permease
MLSRLRTALQTLLRRSQTEIELDEELRYHIEQQTEQNIRLGMNPEEARYAARRAFGGVEQAKEQSRDARGVRWLHEMWQDLRYAARGLSRRPLLSTVVVATLGLGIGVAAGVFTFINAVCLRARIDKDPGSFVRVFSSYTTDPKRPGRPGDTTLEDYIAFRDRASSLLDLIASTDFRPSMEDDPSEVRVLLTTCNFFSLHSPDHLILGRLLQPEDCSAANAVAVLSETAWRDRFGSDPGIIGKAVRFNGRPVTIIGVVPRFGGEINGAIAWMPYTLESYLEAGENLQHPDESAWLAVQGRLKPGFSRRDVAAELGLLASQQDRLHLGRKSAVIVTDGSQIQEPNSPGPVIWIIIFIVAILIIVVLITCANVTTLLLSRADARRQEVAIRLALGAGRIRLIRLLLTETLLQACLAGPLSLYFAYRIPPWLDAWLFRESFPFSLAPDLRVFLSITAITLLAGILAGLAPARQALSVDLSHSLKGQKKSSGNQRDGLRLTGLLIGAQVAMSFTLLVGTGFFFRTYRQMDAADPGFNTKQVFAIRMWMRSNLPPQGSWAVFHRTLTQQIETLPGIQSVAFARRLPFTPVDPPRIQIRLSDQTARQIAYNVISPEFFSTMGIPLASGRAFQESDPFCGRSCPVVVSQELARQLSPGRNPLGEIIQLPNGEVLEVIGVVRDTSTQRIGEPDEGIIYFKWNPNAGSFSPLARFSHDEKALWRAITTKVRETIPNAEVATGTVQQTIDSQLENIWNFGTLIMILGAFAVFLAVIGVYGVVSFAVSRRAKEMGIRIALGAQNRDIYGAVLKGSGRPVIIGLLIGVALAAGAAVALSRLLRMMRAPFVFNPYDPVVYVLAVFLFSTVALIAMLAPARRAAGIDPIAEIRNE